MRGITPRKRTPFRGVFFQLTGASAAYFQKQFRYREPHCPAISWVIMTSAWQSDEAIPPLYDEIASQRRLAMTAGASLRITLSSNLTGYPGIRWQSDEAISSLYDLDRFAKEARDDGIKMR